MVIGYNLLQSVCSRLPLCLLALCLVVLPACTRTIEAELLETRIRDAVIKQGGLSLKSVGCPKSIPLEAGRSFECVGELEAGDSIAIPVRQKDAVGNVEWEVPNAKGLLNLAKIATLFQETVQTESGQTLSIDCGQGYRSVKPGDRFECKVAQSKQKTLVLANKQASDVAAKPNVTSVTNTVISAKKPKQPDAIMVAIDPERNVNWQQVFSPTPKTIASVQNARSPQSSIAPTTASPTQARNNLSTEAAQDLDQLSE